MKKTIIAIALLVSAVNVFAAGPEISEITSKQRSWAGKFPDGEPVKLTVVNEGTFNYSARKGHYNIKAKVSHGGGDAKNNPAVTLQLPAKAGGYVVRCEWVSLDEVTLHWWPALGDMAGQKQNKPPHKTATLKLK